LHIWKEHVEIDQITKFHEKIIWQSLLYRIPLTQPVSAENVIAMTIVMETHNSRITLQYKRRHNVWGEKNVIVNGYLQTLESIV